MRTTSPRSTARRQKFLRCQLAAAGYKEVSLKTIKDGVDYLGAFEAPSPEAPPDPATITPCEAETT